MQQFGDDVYYSRICTELSRRDFEEQQEDLKEANLLSFGPYHKIYNKNEQELKANGLSRFKLVEK